MGLVAGVSGVWELVRQDIISLPQAASERSEDADQFAIGPIHPHLRCAQKRLKVGDTPNHPRFATPAKLLRLRYCCVTETISFS